MNPLFRNFYNAIKSAIEAEKQAFKAAKLLAQSGRRDAKAKIEQARRDIAAMRNRPALAKASTWDRVMRRLGPLGAVVGAMLRPQARSLVDNVDRELRVAAELMAQMGFDITQQERDIARSKSLPTSEGVRSREPQPTLPLTLPGDRQRNDQPDGGDSTQRQTTGDSTPQPTASDMVVVNIGGQRMRLRANSPFFTGEMIRVKSSNVHSIGYKWNHADPARGTLVVRFLDHRKDRGVNRAGAGYEYYAVHPMVFAAFIRASSKGKFVWDKLRVRGTVSGHQYRYSIATLASDGYVPRKARRRGDDEYFLKRTVRGRNGQSYASKLPDQYVGKYRPRPSGGGPNRGTPNRGR